VRDAMTAAPAEVDRGTYYIDASVALLQMQSYDVHTYIDIYIYIYMYKMTLQFQGFDPSSSPLQIHTLYISTGSQAPYRINILYYNIVNYALTAVRIFERRTEWKL